MTIDQLALEKENVVMTARGPSGHCSLTLLPQFGGKIASIRVNGTELLQAPLAPIAPRTRIMRFDQGDAGGWDECLPSVAACAVPVSHGEAEIPDHGDLWRVTWAQSENASAEPASHNTREEAESSLTGECFSLPLVLDRKLSLAATETGWRLDLAYNLTNVGRCAVPWCWSAHPLFSVAPGDRIVLPASVQSLRLEGSRGNRLGISGDTLRWPVADLPAGGKTDLSIVRPPSTVIGDKLFAGPLAAGENWCALERPSAGIRIRVAFDSSLTPYLGLWICYGGWPEREGPKQVCVAIEPSTAPVDSIAIQGPWSRTLAPGRSFQWPMQVDIEPI